MRGQADSDVFVIKAVREAVLLLPWANNDFFIMYYHVYNQKSTKAVRIYG